MSAGVMSRGRAARKQPGLRRAVVAALGVCMFLAALVASGVALLGAGTAATRPGLAAGAALGTPADRSINSANGT